MIATILQRTMRTASLVALSLGGCASQPPVNVHLSTVTAEQLLGTLPNVEAIRSSFTSQERHQYHDCYDPRFARCGVPPESRMVAWQPLLLGCAYDASPEHPHNVNGYCVDLASALISAGNMMAAKGILLHAPGCHGFNVAGDPKELCFSGLIFRSSLSQDMGGWRGITVLTDAEMLTLAKNALQYDPGSTAAASYLARHGANVSVAAAQRESLAQKQRQRETTAEINAATARTIAEDEARTDALLGALNSIPGAGDPNAIVNAANQQAAGMRAIGDAAAARQREPQYRTAAQSGSAVPYSVTNTHTTTGAPAAPTTAAAPTAIAGATTSTSAATTSAGAATLATSASATSTATAAVAPAKKAACTDETNNIAGTAWEDAQVRFAVGSLTNMGYHALYVHFTFAQNGQPNGPGAGALTVQPGQRVFGEAGGVWAANVDNPPRLYWWAVPQSQEDQGHCSGPW